MVSIRFMAPVVLCLILLVPASAGSLATGESSKRYVGGGEFFINACFAGAAGIDIGGGCGMVCTANPCRISLVDDQNGESVFYSVCVRGEPACRPQAYTGTRYVTIVPGSVIDVIPRLNQATTGVVTVS